MKPGLSSSSTSKHVVNMNNYRRTTRETRPTAYIPPSSTARLTVPPVRSGLKTDSKEGGWNADGAANGATDAPRVVDVSALSSGSSRLVWASESNIVSWGDEVTKSEKLTDVDAGRTVFEERRGGASNDKAGGVERRGDEGVDRDREIVGGSMPRGMDSRDFRDSSMREFPPLGGGSQPPQHYGGYSGYRNDSREGGYRGYDRPSRYEDRGRYNYEGRGGGGGRGDSGPMYRDDRFRPPLPNQPPPPHDRYDRERGGGGGGGHYRYPPYEDRGMPERYVGGYRGDFRNARDAYRGGPSYPREREHDGWDGGADAAASRADKADNWRIARAPSPPGPPLPADDHDGPAAARGRERERAGAQGGHDAPPREASGSVGAQGGRILHREVRVYESDSNAPVTGVFRSTPVLSGMPATATPSSFSLGLSMTDPDPTKGKTPQEVERLRQEQEDRLRKDAEMQAQLRAEEEKREKARREREEAERIRLQQEAHRKHVGGPPSSHAPVPHGVQHAQAYPQAAPRNPPPGVTSILTRHPPANLHGPPASKMLYNASTNKMEPALDASALADTSNMDVLKKPSTLREEAKEVQPPVPTAPAPPAVPAQAKQREVELQQQGEGAPGSVWDKRKPQPPAAAKPVEHPTVVKQPEIIPVPLTTAKPRNVPITGIDEIDYNRGEEFHRAAAVKATELAKPKQVLSKPHHKDGKEATSLPPKAPELTKEEHRAARKREKESRGPRTKGIKWVMLADNQIVDYDATFPSTTKRARDEGSVPSAANVTQKRPREQPGSSSTSKQDFGLDVSHLVGSAVAEAAGLDNAPPQNEVEAPVTTTAQQQQHSVPTSQAIPTIPVVANQSNLPYIDPSYYAQALVQASTLDTAAALQLLSTGVSYPSLPGMPSMQAGWPQAVFSAPTGGGSDGTAPQMVGMMPGAYPVMLGGAFPVLSAGPAHQRSIMEVPASNGTMSVQLQRNVFVPASMRSGVPSSGPEAPQNASSKGHPQTQAHHSSRGGKRNSTSPRWQGRSGAEAEPVPALTSSSATSTSHVPLNASAPLWQPPTATLSQQQPQETWSAYPGTFSPTTWGGSLGMATVMPTAGARVPAGSSGFLPSAMLHAPVTTVAAPFSTIGASFLKPAAAVEKTANRTPGPMFMTGPVLLPVAKEEEDNATHNIAAAAALGVVADSEEPAAPPAPGAATGPTGGRGGYRGRGGHHARGGGSPYRGRGGQRGRGK